MNIKNIIFLLLLAACKPNVPLEVKNDKKSVAQKDSITQVTQRKQLTNLTFPRVWFESDLGNVMLRDTPVDMLLFSLEGMSRLETYNGRSKMKFYLKLQARITNQNTTELKI
jgi:hypothetical protein